MGDRGSYVLEQWQIDLIRWSPRSPKNTERFANNFNVSRDTIERVLRGEIRSSGQAAPIKVEKCHEDYMHHPFNG